MNQNKIFFFEFETPDNLISAIEASMLLSFTDKISFYYYKANILQIIL